MRSAPNSPWQGQEFYKNHAAFLSQTFFDLPKAKKFSTSELIDYVHKTLASMRQPMGLEVIWDDIVKRSYENFTAAATNGDHYVLLVVDDNLLQNRIKSLGPIDGT